MNRRQARKILRLYLVLGRDVPKRRRVAAMARLGAAIVTRGACAPGLPGVRVCVLRWSEAGREFARWDVL